MWAHMLREIKSCTYIAKCLAYILTLKYFEPIYLRTVHCFIVIFRLKYNDYTSYLVALS